LFGFEEKAAQSGLADGAIESNREQRPQWNQRN
jgi:hypothetical protein